MKEKFNLRTPGPTPVPDQVKAAMNHEMIGHRGGDFSELFSKTAERVKPIFGTKQEVYILTSSGTSAMEMAVVNTLSPGDEVAVVVTGAFGDRFATICERYGAATLRLDVPWGEACTEERLDDFLKLHPNVKAVIATYCETSTGVLNPVHQLSGVVHARGEALFIVDGVSCVGAVPAKMDEWEIDILVTGSQKAFMLPPGLAFVAVSDRAWKVIKENQAPSFYLNLQAYRNSYQKGMTPYTPAVSLIYGLLEVCTMMEEEGFDCVVERHRLLCDMTRSAVEALGLSLLVEDRYASPTVTAILGNDQFRPDEFRRLLRKEFHVTLAGGQKKLSGEIFRIGHMGWCFPSDIFQVVSAMELGLRKMNVNIELGSGLQAAEEVYAQHV